MKLIVIVKLIIMTTLTSTVAFAKIDMKSNNSYLYSSSYEGFAGYCAVITEELSEVSHKMRKRLNISSTPKAGSTVSYTAKSHSNSSSSPKFSFVKHDFSNVVNTVNKSNSITKAEYTNTKPSLNFSNVANLISNESNI